MEEVKETVETPKYILNKPKAPDIFTMASIIGTIGVNKFAGCLQNEEVQKLVKGISKNQIKIPRVINNTKEILKILESKTI